MKYIAMLFLVLGLVGTMAAQNGAFAPYVSANASTTSALGYKNPDFTFGAGIESSTQHLLLDLHGSFDTANSVRTDNGYTGAVTGSGYLKMFNHVLLGGGANWSVNTAQLSQVRNINGSNIRSVLDATRESAHPFVGGGLQFKRVRVLADYNLPGKDALPNERIVDINTEFFMTKHLRLTQNTMLDSFVNGSSVRVTGTRLGAGVKLVL